MQNEFLNQTLASYEAQAHALEIQQTRVGGLGGSDAAMVLRIATRGLAGLTLTDTKRLCVMLGLQEPESWGGNVYTNAGHAFEDYAEAHLPFGDAGYEREKVLTADLARNFKVFAHADFAAGKNRDLVVECKFVQKPTDKVLAEYHPQLQWYYMLGAANVTLYHGQGKVEPFELEEGKIAQVEREVETIDLLLAGIQILDEALTSGWRPTMPDKALLSDTPEIVRNAFAELARIKKEEAELKARKDAASATLKEYLEGWGFTGLVNEEDKHQVIYTRATTSRTFDGAKFVKEHPEFNDVPAYWKTSNRASSISFK